MQVTNDSTIPSWRSSQYIISFYICYILIRTYLNNANELWSSTYPSKLIALLCRWPSCVCVYCLKRRYDIGIWLDDCLSGFKWVFVKLREIVNEWWLWEEWFVNWICGSHRLAVLIINYCLYWLMYISNIYCCVICVFVFKSENALII